MEKSCEHLVSVIIPVYGVEAYLDRCIQSVVQQTYTNLEIILVDDGSPDRCPEMCDAWAERDSRIHVIHQENAGLSGARNTGISRASGEFLYFVDSDDYIDPETCHIAVDALIQKSADIVVFNMNRVTEQGVFLETTERLERELLSREVALRKLMSGEIHDYVPNKVFRRKMFAEARFPENRCFEDIGTMYRIFLTANSIYTVPEAFYYYVKRKSSTIGSMRNKALCDLFYVRKERYVHMTTIDPELAELALPNTIISALRLYERSLWGKINTDLVDEAQLFLQVHRQKAMETVKDWELKLYYTCPKLYVPFRLAKHRIGTVVKWLLHKTNVKA